MKKTVKNIRKIGLILGFPVFLALIMALVYKESIQQTFTEDKSDLIKVESPIPNEVITAPFTVSGEARGYWFFEASFPVILLDGNGKQLSLGIAEAKDEWMTEDFVPFEAVMFFTDFSTDTGTLVLKKDNPSDLREFDDQIEIPIRFR